MKKVPYETIAGLFVIVGCLVLGYMTIKLGDVSLFDDDSFILKAKFNTVSGLREGNPIEMLGIEIGKVENLLLDQESQLALVQMRIEGGIKVYSDAIVSIKTAGLIGDKYISLDPGGSGTILTNDGVIINTESPTDLSELIGKYAFGSVDDKDEPDLEFEE